MCFVPWGKSALFESVVPVVKLNVPAGVGVDRAREIAPAAPCGVRLSGTILASVALSDATVASKVGDRANLLVVMIVCDCGCLFWVEQFAEDAKVLGAKEVLCLCEFVCRLCHGWIPRGEARVVSWGVARRESVRSAFWSRGEWICRWCMKVSCRRLER